VTLVFAFPDSRHVNCAVPPKPTTAVVGVMFTVIVDVLLELPLLPQETMEKANIRQKQGTTRRLMKTENPDRLMFRRGLGVSPKA
jgi:hypothetical protein